MMDLYGTDQKRCVINTVFVKGVNDDRAIASLLIKVSCFMSVFSPPWFVEYSNPACEYLGTWARAEEKLLYNSY